jgi:Cu+-exporting ATPase
MAKDPVCGMYVDEKTAKFKSQVGGQSYYFCAPGCKTQFDTNPKKYTGAPRARRGCGSASKKSS